MDQLYQESAHKLQVVTPPIQPLIPVDDNNNDDQNALRNIQPVNIVKPASTPTETDKITSEVQPRGSFTTQSYALKKIKKHQKYKYKLCTDVLDSSHSLMVHHQSKHSILYCVLSLISCNWAFTNPTLLIRHQYQHRRSLCVTVGLVSHSPASCKHIQLYITAMLHTIVCTRIVNAHSRTKGILPILQPVSETTTSESSVSLPSSPSESSSAESISTRGIDSSTTDTSSESS